MKEMYHTVDDSREAKHFSVSIRIFEKIWSCPVGTVNVDTHTHHKDLPLTSSG